jgi:hypothetical protein
MPHHLSPLSFTRYDMSDAGSAAALFADSKEVCGIYVLEFEDGMRHVGQTRQIVSRYASRLLLDPVGIIKAASGAGVRDRLGGAAVFAVGQAKVIA